MLVDSSLLNENTMKGCRRVMGALQRGAVKNRI